MGLQWNGGKESTASIAASEWAVSTSWDPTFTTSAFSVATIRVDGAFPSSACGSGWEPGAVAANCVRATWTGSFYDIFDSDIGIDLTPGSTGATWEYANVAPSSTEYSLRGVLTHELGHGILLDDEYSGADCDSTPLTMCGSGGPGSKTWEMRSLQSDDINAANAV